MKYGLFATAICICACAAHSWGAVMEVGYCHGEVSTQTISKVGNCDVSAAVILSPDMLKSYQGAEITGIRLYLATTDNLVDITAWVRDELTGINLAEGAGSIQEGWQTVALSKGLKVGDAPIVIGYTFNQTKTSKCIALGGDVSPQGHYYAKRGEWEVASSPEGSICVELVVEGDQVAASDLGIESVSLENAVVKNGESFRMKTKVRNLSPNEINGFSYMVNCPAMNHTLVEGRYRDVIQPKHAVEIDLDIDGDSFPVDERMLLNFIIEDDGFNDNNTVETECGIYEETFTRKLLIEEFTTEECPNCPRAINSIATALENGYDDDMIVVAHHVGFSTDWLTLPEESDLLWFYGDNGSFAPAVMYDRTVRNADLDTPVESIGYYDTFASRLDEAIGKPGFVKINIEAQASDMFINVNVEAEAHPLLEALLSDPHLTVLLTESGIRHHKQAGISNPEFTHSHASRAYLTDIFGDAVEFDADGKLYWSCIVPCESKWNCENMEAVAFINAYDPGDCTACQIFNVATSHLSTSGVESISSSPEGIVEYYDPAGRRVSHPSNGLYIKTERFDDGTFRTSKIAR